MSSWRFLALERPGAGGRFKLKDRLVCSLGLALGVFFLMLSWGFIVPLERLVKVKILGTLPDRLQVSRSGVSVGPVAFGSDIQEDVVKAVEQVSGVEEVYRQAHFPDPCQLRARYAGEGLVTDLVLEMVDPGQVEHEVASGYTFGDPGPGQPVPVVVPRAILDLVNSGISVNTNLPQLTESALLGKGFDLHLGTSSFRPAPSTQVRCVVVGISDQIGAGGPAIPYQAGIRLSKKSPIVHSLTLALSSPALTSEVTQAIQPLGLRAPRQEIAGKVTGIATLLKFFGSILPLAVLSVTAVALGAILELQVTRERHLIALYRSVGATRRQITYLYLTRAFSVALLSLLVGLAASWLTGRALEVYLKARLPADLLVGHSLFEISYLAFALSVLFCFLLTALAGWFPARYAAHQEPAAVFREPT